MRRGLMHWDAEEIPIEALRARVLRLQSAMAAAGADATILYTNFVRSGAVSYLTAFSPYWAEGVLLVPRRGEALFATTLSKRVGSWIQSVKPVGELVHSPAPGKALGERLAASGARRVAVLELDAFPAGLYEELSAALPGAEIVDGTETFAAARANLDAAERRLLERASAIAQGALGRVNGKSAAAAGHAAGAVEKEARLQGAEEVYVAIAPDLDSDRRFVRLSGEDALGRRFAIRATVAYKGSWVRSAKTYARDETDALAIGRADACFASLLASIDAKKPLAGQIAAGIAALAGAQPGAWLAEAPAGTRPLAPVVSASHVPALVLTLGLSVDGVPWCGAGPIAP